MRTEGAARKSRQPALATTKMTLLCATLSGCLLACEPMNGEPWASAGGAVWTSVTHEAAYPASREHCWSHEAQGVTHDEDNWYISTRDHIYKYPVTADLGQCGYTRSAPLHEWRGAGCPGSKCRCGHFGDISFQGERLYVPLEDCYATTPEGEQRLPDRLFLYDRDLRPVFTATFDSKVQDGATWVAVHPKTGEIWSSDFDADHINVFSLPSKSHAPLRLVRQIELGRTYRAVQGAAFDDDGVLYLVSGDSVDPEQAGIYLFSFSAQGQAVARQFIPPGGYQPGFGYWEELEGITVWDVSKKNAPNIQGQIHWIVLDNDANQDDVTFEHVSVDRTATLPMATPIPLPEPPTNSN